MNKTKFVVGVDPGKKGAYVIMGPGLDFKTHVMPVVGGDINVMSMAKHILELGDTQAVIVVIEKVHSMPKQSSQSTFTFGSGYGKILGLCQTLGLKYDLVLPQTWKRRVLADTNKDKKSTISFVNRSWPEIDLVPAGCRVAHDGIADAVCIAKWGYDKHVLQIF